MNEIAPSAVKPTNNIYEQYSIRSEAEAKKPSVITPSSLSSHSKFSPAHLSVPSFPPHASQNETSIVVFHFSVEHFLEVPRRADRVVPSEHHILD
mmetsp:Transcript_7016/g.10493  ORF Transcript_7016/g.10493 Transcript_7016/m.10493 type:complete len:95 (+) Transcript_7016:65-349(+)|eukprot:CAMPEP_0116014316 /NCGR_PEP_ID=MMETSP0321-20121206/6209_1 /TAXON_ID=163516 /ORGANISM="Leptocylindrus danicus var. danicus, Strain B650" /LENGTH=94 /DNA_ID=CAMNT_0003483953 /DNA_START=37 /DNA_END=321 /DNA_ORIENTATION=+